MFNEVHERKKKRTEFATMADTAWAYAIKVPRVSLPSVLPWAELLVHRRPPSPTVFHLRNNATTYYLYLVQE